MARRETVATGPGSRALVVDLIRASGAISRAELVDRTGLTQPSISMIVRALIGDGVVRETGQRVSSGGKPAVLVELNAHASYGIGLHLGGDALTAVATDASGGIVGRMVAAAPKIGSAGDLAGASTAIVSALLGQTRLDRSAVAGVAVVGQGPVDAAAGRLLGPGLTAGGVSSREDLSAAWGLPVLVTDEAAAATLGEFWGRRVSRDRTFGCLHLGSGLAAGLVVGGALQRGASSNAGALGHVSIDPVGPPCSCGGRGCLDTYVAPEVLARQALDAGVVPASFGSMAVERVVDALATAAVRGEPAAVELVDRAAARIAQGALVVVNLWDVDTLVLTGPGFAVAGARHVTAVRALLDARSHARALHRVDVQLASNPGDAAAIGGAALVVQEAMAPGHGPGLRPDTMDIHR